jgi:uncharacterized membrane protein
MSDEKSERFLGLDLVRFFSFLAIHVYHITQAGWGDQDYNLGRFSNLCLGLEWYARELSFSGFSIVLLTSFLKGQRKNSLKNHLALYGFMLMGWLLFCAAYTWKYELRFMWDVYPLLVLGFFSASLLRSIHTRLIYILGIASLVLLWIPLWKLSSFHWIPFSMKAIWVGDCDINEAEWPILPWIGLIWLGYAAGTFVRGRFLALKPLELIFWVPCLLLSIPQLGKYAQVPVNSGYACFIFRQEMTTLWSHLIWIVFLMRLSLDPGIQDFLTKRKWVRFLSQTRFSTKFWLFYFVHYIACFFLFHGHRTFYLEHPRVAELAMLGLPILVELFCRVIVKQ